MQRASYKKGIKEGLFKAAKAVLFIILRQY
jgi:hypothetical protein